MARGRGENGGTPGGRGGAKFLASAVDGSGEVRLDDFDPKDTAGLDKAAAVARLEELGPRLSELTNLLAYASDQALLVIFQGRDASGKDGVIRRVLEYANVLAAKVQGFKAPTAEELAHDFLWRVHKVVPKRGEIGLFNRSHYEDVIAARVHQLVPREVWKARYDHINDFERLLAESGTIVVKFMLHVSKDEQRKRLEEREADPRTAWKLNVGDWQEIPLWDETTAAYDDALSRCSSPELPWIVVPSDRKWFRNLCVFERLVAALEPHRDAWLAKLKKMRKDALKEIEPIRKNLDDKD
jgi:PPK2 family polyphosphate:nucleotide phosphotransferase